jgi:hypothetical protein
VPGFWLGSNRAPLKSSDSVIQYPIPLFSRMCVFPPTYAGRVCIRWVIASVKSRKLPNRRDLRKLRPNRWNWERGVSFSQVDWMSDQNSDFQESDFDTRMKIFWRYRKTIVNRNNSNFVSWEQRYDRTHRDDNGKWRRLDDSDKTRTNSSGPKMGNLIINVIDPGGNDWLGEN